MLGNGGIDQTIDANAVDFESLLLGRFSKHNRKASPASQQSNRFAMGILLSEFDSVASCACRALTCF